MAVVFARMFLSLGKGSAGLLYTVMVLPLLTPGIIIGILFILVTVVCALAWALLREVAA